MATINGLGARLDMREMLFLGEVARQTPTVVTIGYGGWTNLFEGAFGVTSLGLTTGTLTGFSLSRGGATLYEATGVERSAYTAIGIARTGDNDRFLAYTLSDGDRLGGTSGADYLLGFGGDDAIYGRGGDDELFGGSDDDRIYGGSGDDLLAGGLGVDRLYGGAGDDTYVIDASGDQATEAAGEGWDIVLSSVGHALGANVEELGLTGTASINGRGTDFGNVMRGNSGENLLLGLGGADTLAGLSGDDVLVGGAGRDLLSGGYGDDAYRFGAVSDSGPAASKRDKILDFWSGEDVIDLAAIDANSDKAGNQAFTFGGAGSFSGAAGEIRVAAGRVSADIDGDRAADFAIDLQPLLVLGRDDFIL